jgi:UDP-N-acetylmuramate dehydrogenase
LKISKTQMKIIGSFLEEPLALGIPLKRLTSYRIGGPADVVAFPGDTKALIRILRFVKQEGISHFLLGNGTNVLFDDQGFRGLIIAPTRMKKFSVCKEPSGATLLTAQAGMPLSLVVWRASRLGFCGMEPLWGIPGSVGGSVACNAGAGGTSLCDIVSKITILNMHGEETELEKGAFSFGYRFCDLPPESVVLKTFFHLGRKNPDEIMKTLEYFRNIRRLSQPRGFPSCGCVFKNSSNGLAAGELIERLGFKGVIEGGAQVSKVHANFIINRNKAKARDVLVLIEKIVESAQNRAGIKLELEIKVVTSGK